MASDVLSLPHTYQSVPGFFWFPDAYRRLLALLPPDRPSTFVEIGALQGKSTCFLGVEILNSGKPVSLHVVDLWQHPDAQTGAGIRKAFDQHTATIAGLLGERFRVTESGSVAAAQLVENESVDVVWIDGDHNYAEVKADILSWFPKLKHGGWIGGDDWNMEPVQRAVVEQFAPHYILGHGYCTSDKYSGPWPWWMARKA